MAHSSTSSDSFLQRLQDLPFVKDSVDKVGALYSGTKQYNSLLRRTLETAESGVGMLASTTKPLLNVLEKPIGSINDLACKELEKMEKNYPIIAQPTEEMIKQTKAVVQPLADRLKPVTDRVNSITTYGLDTITSTKGYAADKVGALSEYGLSKVNVVKSYARDTVSNLTGVATRQVSPLVDNKVGLLILSQLEKLIESAELANKEDLQVTESSKESNDGDISSTAAINRLFRVVDVFRCVLYTQSTKKLQCVRSESSKALSRISPASLLDWTSYKNTAYNFYNEKKDRIVNVWNAVNNPNYVASENEAEISKYETGLISALRYLKTKTEAGLTLVEENVNRALTVADAALPSCLKNILRKPLKYISFKKSVVLMAEEVEKVKEEPETNSSSEDSCDDKKSEEDVYHSPAKHHPDDELCQ